jgi:hypothetical protein
MSGFRVCLFRHEIRQIEEHAAVSKAPTDDPTKEKISVKPYTDVTTTYGQVHSIDEGYESIKARLFGET